MQKLREGIIDHKSQGNRWRTDVDVLFPTLKKFHFTKDLVNNIKPLDKSILRIVHFDLKGAPWKVSYFEQVLLAIKKWKATGVLLEWEDTFPYSGELAVIGSQGGSSGEGMYSIEEVRHIIKFAEDINLTVIQLVQTIGHMEFVLKHPQYKNLCEKPKWPAVLCPSKTESQQLVRQMLEQVLDVQPNAWYIHIGADEVWHSAVCDECKRRAEASEAKAPALFLEHIRDLCLFVKAKRPNLTVLMWDDMLRTMDVEILHAYQLGGLVEPVLWDYYDMSTLTADIWSKYKAVFPKLWGASAFKGANGSSQMIPCPDRYLMNQKVWADFIETLKPFCVPGLILTGWSRYSHYATLCELLPVALPTLEACLAFLTNGTASSRHDDWPGKELALSIEQFAKVREESFQYLRGDRIATFMNTWQTQRRYTIPYEAEAIYNDCQRTVTYITSLREHIAAHLQAVTGPRSADEWLVTNFAPVLRELAATRDAAWPRIGLEPSVAPE